MGHIAHLRKQFKSLNKYDYIITLIQRIKKKLYENLLVLHLNKLESPSPKDALCQVWLKLAQWFWRRRFFNFVNVFKLFYNCLHLEKEGPYIWTKLNPVYPRMHCAKFGWNGPSGSGEEDEYVKSLWQGWRKRQGTTDKFWSEKAYLSLRLRWAKKQIDAQKNPQFISLLLLVKEGPSRTCTFHQQPFFVLLKN